MATILAQPPRRGDTAAERFDMTAAAHGRLMLVLLLFAGAAIGLAVWLLVLGIQAALRTERPVAATLARADILDRNGMPLARNIDAYAVAVRPDLVIGDKRELAARLHAIFPDQDEESFYRVLTSRSKWAFLRRRALPEDVEKVNALGQVAIEFPREKERLYPQRSLAAHLIGYTDLDGHGGMGVERAFDRRLSDPAMLDQPLLLAIDARAQGAMEEELARGIIEQNAKGGVGIVLDVHSGEVLVMVSLPTYNPNKLEQPRLPDPLPPSLLGKDGKLDWGKIPCEYLPRCNRALGAVYELGSIFKPLSIGAAMEAGVVTSMSKVYDATRPLQVGRRLIHDDHAQNRWLNVPETMIHSSNIVTSRIAEEMGQERLRETLAALGFTDRPEIDLDVRERAKPLVQKGDEKGRWSLISTMNVAFGQGIAETPLHLATAYAALVNGGLWHPATVLKRNPGEPVQGRRVFSEGTSLRMRQLLRLNVVVGTGKSADAPGYRLGGKTGTADKPHEGRYATNSVVSTFASAFPMDDPKYVVLVMMDEPRGSARYPNIRTAAYTVAPVVKAFIERTGPMLGVYPDPNRDLDISELIPLVDGSKEAE